MKCHDFKKGGTVVGWLVLVRLFLREFVLAPTQPTTQPTQLAIIVTMYGNTSI